MARIFISYKRADKTAVLALKERIETATGEPCWTGAPAINGITLTRALEILTDLKNLL